MAFHQLKCGKLTQNIDSEMVSNKMDAAARFFLCWSVNRYTFVTDSFKIDKLSKFTEAKQFVNMLKYINTERKLIHLVSIIEKSFKPYTFIVLNSFVDYSFTHWNICLFVSLGIDIMTNFNKITIVQ